MTGDKRVVDHLAIFGGPRLFSAPKPTSNLVRPDFAKFLEYSRVFIDAHEYTNSTTVRRLERSLAAFHHAKFCISLCSGFWALALAMQALALPGRDEVILPSLTYRRMADVAAWVGLKPRFCEIEGATLANSAETVRRCIDRSTALIVGVHPFVNVCDVEGLVQLAGEAEIPLLFDSVESVYEWLGDRKIGSFGAAEVYSLGASKLINGFEGGYVTTGDARLAERLVSMREGGSVVRASSGSIGINVRLNEVHAAMALATLDDLEDQVRRNRKRYGTYQQLLATVHGVRLVEFDEGQRPAYKNIVIEILGSWPLSRDDTVAVLNAEMILARAYYGTPLHRKHMAYAHVPASLPATESFAERYVVLPSGQLVEDEDIRRIMDVVRLIAARGAEIGARLQQRVAASRHDGSAM